MSEMPEIPDQWLPKDYDQAKVYIDTLERHANHAMWEAIVGLAVIVCAFGFLIWSYL